MATHDSHSAGDTLVSNRSEILLLTDARNTNPNGDPRSADDKPRQDDNGIGIITDSRFKRYLRDQLSEDGFGVLLESPRFIPDGVSSREELYLRLLDMSPDAIADADDATLREQFLTNATDVRYFGATVSLKKQDGNNDEDAELETAQQAGVTALRRSLKPQYIGPVQFGHGESLHPVELNDESSRLAVTSASKASNTQGTFATDNRVRFGVYRFDGIVNENAARNTGLTEADVARLDSLIWRAWKNQILTRSKQGQAPRLYLRVEYATDSFHIGDLNLGVTLPDDATPRTFQNITDVTLDVSSLIDRLDTHSQHIETIHLIESDYLSYASIDSLTTALIDHLGDDSVVEPEPYADADKQH